MCQQQIVLIFVYNPIPSINKAISLSFNWTDVYFFKTMWVNAVVRPLCFVDLMTAITLFARVVYFSSDSGCLAYRCCISTSPSTVTSWTSAIARYDPTLRQFSVFSPCAKHSYLNWQKVINAIFFGGGGDDNANWLVISIENSVQFHWNIFQCLAKYPSLCHQLKKYIHFFEFFFFCSQKLPINGVDESELLLVVKVSLCQMRLRWDSASDGRSNTERLIPTMTPPPTPVYCE